MPSYTLRDYQLGAVDAAIEWMKKNSDPAVLSLSGGAGKSIIIAEIARILFNMTGKRILCLVPSRTLAEQNGEKMAMTGEKFSFYSASISKSLRHKIVIATEGTFKSVALSHGDQFAAILVDEADRVTETFKQIVEDMRSKNPLLRVIGLTGSPFRLSSGYIYELDLDNRVVADAIDPYYKKLIYSVTCNELIDQGYLTPIQVGAIAEHYNTENLKIDTKNESFTTKSLNEMLSDGGVTERIVQDFLAKTKDKKGVMIFCTSIKHAEDVYSMLPSGEAVILHGKLSKAEQSKAVSDFKSGKAKYFVNVDMGTVGFDCPRVDCLVLLRPTASNRLMQQILWRGVRLYDGKEYCLLLDYTDNIPNLFGDNPDIFTPQIKAYGSRPSIPISFSCPDCGTINEASKRQGFESYSEVGGFALDLAGDVIKTDGDQLMPAHHSRRCCGVVLKGKNQYERCGFYWAHKTCPECGEKCDIAAKNCNSCGFVLIRPDEKLNETAYVLKVGDTLTANVEKMEIEKSSNGQVVIAKFWTPHKNIMSKMYPHHKNHFITLTWRKFSKITNGGEIMPKAITYTIKKDGMCVINDYHMECA